MDVDGVLNPYPDCPEGYEEYEFFPGDEHPVRLSAAHGEWLRELASYFSMGWATGWGDDANRLLSPHFGLPELPVVVFQPGPFEPTAKLPAIDAFAGDRAAAWVDDLVTPEIQRWAEERTDPTLLLEIDPAIGLTRETVDLLVAWALALRSNASSSQPEADGASSDIP
jgi:hypothetical protein